MSDNIPYVDLCFLKTMILSLEVLQGSIHDFASDKITSNGLN